MKEAYDHVLLIGFGGPESPQEIMPFLRRVTAGKRISDARLQEVAHHYEKIGGKSPYNSWAVRLQKDLKAALDSSLPIFLGHRNTAPFLKDVLLEIHGKGLKKGVAVILAPFRSTTSCRRYKENIHDALHENGIIEHHYSYLSPWYNHPAWIQLLTDLTQKTFGAISDEVRGQTEILFSCHSIPVMADKACPSCIYSAEYEAASRLVAQAAGFSEWKHVYQSRSGDPSQPWLEPDILETIKFAAAAGKKAVLAIPMGFLSDNAEVLYDLDIEAKKLAEELRMKFYRVATPGNHPDLTKLFVKLIGQILKTGEAHKTCEV